MTSIIGKVIGAIERLIQGPMTSTEVQTSLNKLAATKTERLAWQTSVVDLLKLLDLDSSLNARRMLADELAFEGDFSGSAKDNEALHELVMEDIARRYTKIPGV